MKKIGSLAVALTLTASMTLPALAAGNNLVIAPAPGAEQSATAMRYNDVLVVNGKELDASKLPDVEGIPMRLLLENDHGNVEWYAETSEGAGYFDGSSVLVNVNTFAITINDEVVDGTTAQVKEAVTVTDLKEGGKRYEVTTPNGAPLVELGYQILEAAGTTATMKMDLASYEENYSLPAGTFADGVNFQGMMTSPDCLLVAKLSEKADREAVMEAMKANQKSLEDTFSWYLSQNLPKVQDARMVIEGDYVMFLIAENADAGEKLFRDYVAAQKTIDVVVVDKEGKSTTLTCETGEEFLGAALVKSGAVDGVMGEYGLFITTVNGYTANEEAQEWWCITKNGQEVSTGADTTPIADGDQFELTLKTGW